MIPRYAVLRPLSDGPAMATSEPARSLDGAVVMAAFDVFCRDLERLLEEVVEKDELLEAARSSVALARERFLAALGKDGKSDVQPVAREE